MRLALLLLLAVSCTRSQTDGRASDSASPGMADSALALFVPDVRLGDLATQLRDGNHRWTPGRFFGLVDSSFQTLDEFGALFVSIETPLGDTSTSGPSLDHPTATVKAVLLQSTDTTGIANALQRLRRLLGEPKVACDRQFNRPVRLYYWRAYTQQRGVMLAIPSSVWRGRNSPPQIAEASTPHAVLSFGAQRPTANFLPAVRSCE